ncbi:MAG: cytochrome d ubiquinol oxidase subunit II [Selenomonadaceae bacterium]|nr:cytochrome d ubiquinol oxidase subunit II [Selenomonadaceae bacterium]
MDLNIVWFILITVLFTGFFILEGFDYGVGMMMIGRPKNERAQFVRAIGPVWDGNEVWMITAGGATFAAFPHVYATMFSTFYLALFLMLLALILRGVAFELRGKLQFADWINFWDFAIMFGSFIPALLWGVAVTNLLRGLPINFQMHFVGDFLDLLNPCALLGGIFFVLLFLFHGANFLSLKIADKGLVEEIQRKSFCYGVATTIFYAVFAAVAAVQTDILAKPATVIFLAVSVASVLLGCYSAKVGNACKAFSASTVAIATLTAGFFIALFPRIMVSSISPDFSLNIYNAASTPNTLFLMTVAAVIFVPIVLCYQAWSYKVFKDRITPADVHYH